MCKLEANFESLSDFEREQLKFKITPKGLQRVFSCGSTGKESACNAGDLGLIPGLEDPLEEGMATHETTPVFFAGVQPQLIQGIRRRDGVGEGQETTA